MDAWTVAASLPAAAWCSALALPSQAWRTRERLVVDPQQRAPAATELTVLIPARNEASCIARTLSALAAQGVEQVVLVDDDSSDGTAELARAAMPGIEIVVAQPLPAGWSGKLWALEQGLQRVQTPWLLLLDADIELAAGSVAALHHQAVHDDRQLVSVMARLSMSGFWERALLPAFIYFFKLLYPFASVNDPRRRCAGAAGGCLLLQRELLLRIGGFAALREAIIDDCTLARRVADHGGRLWLGLCAGVTSQRQSEGLGAIWNMVARTAFIQLRSSWLLLGLCTLLMLLLFGLPLLALALGPPLAQAFGAVALLAMGVSYLPTLRWSDRSCCWAPTLPLVALLYLMMTWTSAWRHLRGVRSRWKGRTYHREAAASEAVS